jgi:hypothetical protein
LHLLIRGRVFSGFDNTKGEYSEEFLSKQKDLYVEGIVKEFWDLVIQYVIITKIAHFFEFLYLFSIYFAVFVTRAGSTIIQIQT